MVKMGADGPKPCVRPELDHSGPRVTAVRVGLRDDVLADGMEDDWAVVPQTGMTWMVDRINHDRPEVSPLSADQSNLSAEPGAAGG
eukprot:2236774-Rhodomonas_salina.1